MLKPIEAVRLIYAYCLAEAARRFNITLHAWEAMSNHQHVIFTDNEGNYPEFIERLDKNLAKALNALWGRSESVWPSSQQANVVRLVTPADAFDKLVYVVGNSVRADLVDKVADWPGENSLAQNITSRARIIERPRRYFSKNSRLPATVELVAERLPGFDHLSDEQWHSKVRDAIRDFEAHHRERRRAEKKGILGRKEVLRQEWWQQPSTALPHRRARPEIVCADRARRKKELDELRAFRVAHRNALLRLKARERGVVFPFGTYRVRRFGVRCHDANDVTIAPPPLVDAANTLTRETA